MSYKIYLYDTDTDCIGSGTLSSSYIQSQLEAAAGQDVEVHISSVGGSAFDAIAIYDLLKKYEGNVVDIFAQRLIRSDRTDVQKFYDFWEIEERYFSDKFYLLGHTQGLLPTDNFEFLADYNAIPGIHFLTDIAALSVMQHSPDVITDRDELQIKLETENEHDPHAVAVYKGDLKIGYIKKIHCHVFHKPGGENLKLKIKAIDKNGVIKRIFVKVYSDKQS